MITDAVDEDMYNAVVFSCRECGGRIFKTLASTGKYILPPKATPVHDALLIDGHVLECMPCGTEHVIKIIVKDVDVLLEKKG